MSISHISSVSTNTRETADQQIGPSRSLGIFLGYLGDKLEARVEKLSRGRKTSAFTSQHATAPAPGALPNSAVNVLLGQESFHADTFSTISSDGTASNVAGPAATLGKLFDYLGRSLEKHVNNMAARSGLGPNAVGRRLSKYHHRGRPGWSDPLSTKEHARLLKECSRLLKYAQSSTLSTQYQALGQMIMFSGEDLVIREAFVQSGAEIFLHTFPKLLTSRRSFIDDFDPDLLLSSSRKALVCVEENEVSLVAKDISSFRSLESNYVLGDPTLMELVVKLFKLAQTTGPYAFLALRNIFHLSRHWHVKYDFATLRASTLQEDHLSQIGMLSLISFLDTCAPLAETGPRYLLRMILLRVSGHEDHALFRYKLVFAQIPAKQRNLAMRSDLPSLCTSENEDTTCVISDHTIPWTVQDLAGDKLFWRLGLPVDFNLSVHMPRIENVEFSWERYEIGLKKRAAWTTFWWDVFECPGQNCPVRGQFGDPIGLWSDS